MAGIILVVSVLLLTDDVSWVSTQMSNLLNDLGSAASRRASGRAVDDGPTPAPGPGRRRRWPTD